MPQYLSKSDYKLARDCPTKLYYQKLHYPSRHDDDAFGAMLAEGGFVFEALAKLQYPDGITIDESLSLEESAATTLLALQADQVTLFEATFISHGKLARVDILVKHGNTLDLIEVKSKSYHPDDTFRSGKSWSSEWLPYLEDVAFQALVLQECLPDVEIRPFLLLPDTTQTLTIEHIRTWFALEQLGRAGEWVRRVVAVTGDAAILQQQSVMALVPVASEIADLLPEVARHAARFLHNLNPLVRAEPQLTHRCGQCEYRLAGTAERNGFVECWRELAQVDHHLLDLYFVGATNVAQELIGLGTVHLFDVPPERLRTKNGSIGKRNRRQLIQLEYTRQNREWVSDELPAVLQTLEYPLHFVDFETARFVLPSHANLAPYALEAFQWSCHTLVAPDAPLTHSEWINSGADFPNERFARSLMAQLGTNGTMLAWGHHESTTLRQIAEQLAVRESGDAALHEWLATMSAKGHIIDMNALTIEHYFHPLMRGQTSLKVVADAIWRSEASLRERFAALLDVKEDDATSLYKTLRPVAAGEQTWTVQNGTEALRAYQAMIDLLMIDHPEAAIWGRLLLDYCRLDTLAMVLVWQRWRELCDK